MTNDDHVIDLLPGYALGCLDEAETRVVSAHLAMCATCRTELRVHAATCDQLALASPSVVPPQALKTRVMAAARQARAAHALPPTKSLRERLAGLLRLPGPAWSAASLALVVLLLASNAWWWQRASPQSAVTLEGGMRVVAMDSAGTATGAAGTLVISEDGEYGTLVVDGLPPLEADQQYQLWLIRDDQRTSGGVFSVSHEGYGALVVASPDPLSSYPTFGVTIEPAGGSPAPTGDKVLGGSL